LITFDVNTALFDLESSLVPMVGQVLPPEEDSAGFVRLWHQIQKDYMLISNSLGQRRVPFHAITRRALDYALSEAGVDLLTAQGA